jgi:hypothetical protein
MASARITSPPLTYAWILIISRVAGPPSSPQSLRPRHRGFRATRPSSDLSQRLRRSSRWREIFFARTGLLAGPEEIAQIYLEAGHPFDDLVGCKAAHATHSGNDL